MKDNKKHLLKSERFIYNKSPVLGKLYKQIKMNS